MKVLSLSSVYPNTQEPGLGLFVRSRLEGLSGLAELKVVAPTPLLDYSQPNGKWLSRRRSAFHAMETTEVLRPRWIFPPGGTPANVLCLAARLLPVMARLRKKFLFELIDAHFGYPEGVAAGLLAEAFRVPFIITLRGNEPSFARHWGSRKAMIWALSRAAAVIAVSADLAHFAVQHGAAAAQVYTIGNGVDTDLFYPRDRQACRARLGIEGHTNLIVCAGELIEAKGHHFAVRAAAELRSRGKNVLLIIAGGVARGGKPFDAQLRLLVGELGIERHVRLAGPMNRHQMADLLSAADVFTLPSFTEGCPNVVNEALACGAPVVASAVGAVPQMVASDRYGLVVPPRDQPALTTALSRALDTEWDRAAISIHGRARPWSVVASEVMAVLRQAACTGRPQPRMAAEMPSCPSNRSSHVRD
jgi:teichuronic acid biosynthesis glycosyltransferase TuaC